MVGYRLATAFESQTGKWSLVLSSRDQRAHHGPSYTVLFSYFWRRTFR